MLRWHFASSSTPSGATARFSPFMLLACCWHAASVVWDAGGVRGAAVLARPCSKMQRADRLLSGTVVVRCAESSDHVSGVSPGIMLPALFILAEGAIALPVTLSGGALFAS